MHTKALPLGLPSSAPEVLLQALSGPAGRQAPALSRCPLCLPACASVPAGLIFQPPPPGSAVRLSSAPGLALLPEDSSLFFPVCPESEIL